MGVRAGCWRASLRRCPSATTRWPTVPTRRHRRGGPAEAELRAAGIAAPAPGEPRARAQRKRSRVGDWMRQTFLKPEDPAVARAESPRKLAIGRRARRPRQVRRRQGAGHRSGGGTRRCGRSVSSWSTRSSRTTRHSTWQTAALNPHYVNTVAVRRGSWSSCSSSPLSCSRWRLLRKRLFLGIATALYGLAIFNLHYWGFGIPFIMRRGLVPGSSLPAAARAARGNRCTAIAFRSGLGRSAAARTRPRRNRTSATRPAPLHRTDPFGRSLRTGRRPVDRRLSASTPTDSDDARRKEPPGV